MAKLPTLADHSPLTRRLIEDGLSPAPSLSAAWRRGMMHAVERIDLVLAKRLRPAATLAEIREVLDDLTTLQREHFPGTYEEVFRICSADLDQAKRKPGIAA